MPQPYAEVWPAASRSALVLIRLVYLFMVRVPGFQRGGRAVITARCGLRAHTRELRMARLQEYTADRGPLHLQRLIPGHDVRAHVIGTEVLAVRIDSDKAVDYRTDRSARYSTVALPGELQALLVEATPARG